MIECEDCFEPASILSVLTDPDSGRKYFYAECAKHYAYPEYDGDVMEFWYLSEQDWQTDQLKEAL